MDLLHDALDEAEVGVIFAGEVEDGDVARLAVAVEAAVALFEAGRVPGDFVVEDVAGGRLEVEAFGGGVGGEQDADRVVGLVERGLDAVALGGVEAAVEGQEAPVGSS